MRFKTWLEEILASGVISPVFTDQPKPQASKERRFANRGVRDKYTQSEVGQRLPPEFRRKPLG